MTIRYTVWIWEVSTFLQIRSCDKCLYFQTHSANWIELKRIGKLRWKVDRKKRMIMKNWFTYVKWIGWFSHELIAHAKFSIHVKCLEFYTSNVFHGIPHYSLRNQTEIKPHLNDLSIVSNISFWRRKRSMNQHNHLSFSSLEKKQHTFLL